MSTDLAGAATLAHDATVTVTGEISTCILTSHALAQYLYTSKGLEPELVRVTAGVWPEGTCACHGWPMTGAVLGSDGGGTRRPAAPPDSWWGHLAVLCGGYLLDATLPQVNRRAGDDCRIGEIALEPVAVAIPDGWDDGESATLRCNGTAVWYRRYHRQNGWRSAGDARPSHYVPVYRAMCKLEADLSPR